ncbi:MAG TPA: hypothetical protein EYN06_05455, partial [Myxococcales bacterium]|nr:hypothetical protein [Myxococcales bacterium]
MMLPEYLRKTGVEYPLPAPVLDVLDTSESVNVQEDMSAHRTALGLLEHANVVEIMQARGRWLDWRICRDQINFDRDAEGKDLLPLEWIEETTIDHELPVLSRVLDSL